MRHQNRSDRERQQNRTQDRGYGRSERNERSENQSSRNAGGRSDWYDQDPMDDRSGYRDEERNYSSRRDSSDLRGYNDHYRYDQNYHNYYGSTDYNPDRERSYSSSHPSSYDSDRYSRGQGAYGTTSSGRASWDTNVNQDSNRFSGNQDYQRNSDYGYGRNASSQDRSSSSSYGRTSQGSSWSPSEETQRDNSFYGRGPKSFKRSDERIKEEVCEMLTRHSGIDADEIEVEVKEGEVTLTGSVSERRMKHLAEDCAEQCFGVKDVTNNIRVKRSMDSEVSDRGDFGSSNRDRSLSSSTSSSKKPSSSGSSTPGH